MSCEIDAGYSKGCRNGRGGVKSVIFIQIEHVTFFALTATNEVSAIVIASTFQGWQFNLEMNLSTFTDTLTGSRENGSLFAEQSLTAILNDNLIATRNTLMLLAQNDCVAIVQLANGDYEMLGATNGLSVVTDTRDVGTVKADRNGHTIVMAGQEDELAYKVDSTIIAGLLTPAP